MQSSEARVQQNKGRQKQYNKQKTKSGQAFAWPIYIQEYRDEECGVFYLLYYWATMPPKSKTPKSYT